MIVEKGEQFITQRDQFQCFVNADFFKECGYCLNDDIQENLEWEKSNVHKLL